MAAWRHAPMMHVQELLPSKPLICRPIDVAECPDITIMFCLSWFSFCLYWCLAVVLFSRPWWLWWVSLCARGGTVYKWEGVGSTRWGPPQGLNRSRDQCPANGKWLKLSVSKNAKLFDKNGKFLAQFVPFCTPNLFCNPDFITVISSCKSSVQRLFGIPSLTS